MRVEILSLSTRRALGMEPPEHGWDSSLTIQRVNKIFWRKEGLTTALLIAANTLGGANLRQVRGFPTCADHLPGMLCSLARWIRNGAPVGCSRALRFASPSG